MYKVKKIDSKFRFSKYTKNNERIYAAEGSEDQIIDIALNEGVEDIHYAIEMLNKYPQDEYYFTETGRISTSKLYINPISYLNH